MHWEVSTSRDRQTVALCITISFIHSLATQPFGERRLMLACRVPHIRLPIGYSDLDRQAVARQTVAPETGCCPRRRRAGAELSRAMRHCVVVCRSRVASSSPTRVFRVQGTIPRPRTSSVKARSRFKCRAWRTIVEAPGLKCLR